MFIGEAPGKEEDLTGRPFIGRSGRFLTDMLSTIGRARTDFFITSCVKCRPPQNRQPRPDELATCNNLWLQQQIDRVQPKLIICLGGVSAKTLLGPTDLRQQHGTIVSKGDYDVFLTYHPSAAMRFPKIRHAMTADFQQLDRLLQARSP
jgi:DNA polymerase